MKKLDAQLSSERSHANKMPAPQKRLRKTPIEKTRVDKFLNGDKMLTFNFAIDTTGYDIIKFMAADWEDMTEFILNNVDNAINDNPSIIRLVNDDNTFVKVEIRMDNFYDDQAEEKFISSRFHKSKNSVFKNLKEKIRKYFEKYEEDNLQPTSFKLIFMTTAQVVGQGGAARTLDNANKTWLKVSFQTRYNCLYVAVQLGHHVLNKNADYKEFVDNPQKIMDIAKKMKSHMKEKFDTCPKRLFSDIKELTMCADMLKCEIKLYNNLYQCIQHITPTNAVKSKKTKARKCIEIQVANNHSQMQLHQRSAGL